MSTELLREQFNLMQNEQKIKLEKLKQKKMMMKTKRSVLTIQAIVMTIVLKLANFSYFSKLRKD